MRRNETINTVSAQYTCSFRPAAEGGYTVTCAAFPGLITEGSTLEDARNNAREALELCIEVYQQESWSLPPSDHDPQKAVKEIVPVKMARR
jgi:antitoxin HicB